MKKYVIFFLLFFLTQNVFSALPSDFSNIFVFGDSLSDIGNFKAKKSNCLLPAGTSAPVTNKTGGAFPGKIWVNFLFQHYGFVPQRGSKNHPEGNVWSYAGDLTLGVVIQIENYLAENSVDPNALYVIWAGSNDSFRLLPENQPPGHPVTPPEVVLQGIMNIYGGISDLYSKGARRFLVIGMPDASLTPGVIFQSREMPALIPQLHALSLGWNQALFSPDASSPGRAPLAYLKKLHSDIEIFTWDPNRLLDAVTKNPAAYGFPPLIIGQRNNHLFWCGPFMGEDPDLFIFFNGIHPTSHAHSVIATTVLNEAVKF